MSFRRDTNSHYSSGGSYNMQSLHGTTYHQTINTSTKKMNLNNHTYLFQKIPSSYYHNRTDTGKSAIYYNSSSYSGNKSGGRGRSAYSSYNTRGGYSNYTTRDDFTMNRPHDAYIQTITTTQETIIRSMSKSLSQNAIPNYANTTKTDKKSAKNNAVIKKEPEEKQIKWTEYVTYDDVFAKDKSIKKKKQKWDYSEYNNLSLGGWGESHYNIYGDKKNDSDK